MKNTIIIIVLIFLIITPIRVLASGAPITESTWEANYTIRNHRIDTARSTVIWQSSSVTLAQSGGQYLTSGILWTQDISFNQDIYSLTPTASIYQPDGTSTLVSLTLGSNAREYPLSWGTNFKPEGQIRTVRLKVFLSTTNINISPAIYKLVLQVQLQDRSTAGVANRDKQRVANLKTTDNILDRYQKDFSIYPVVNTDKNDKTGQWRVFKQILDSATTNYRKSYNSGFVTQATGVDEEYKYGYWTDSSGYKYLLWVQLENKDSDLFKDSWVGTIFDIKCEAPVFCLCSEPVISEPGSTPSGPLIRQLEEPENGNLTIPIPEKLSNVSFIRAENDSRVWLKLNNRLVWVRTPEIFQKLGGAWDNVAIVKSLTNQPLFKLIKTKNSPAVYLITASGFKHPLFNMTHLGFYASAIDISVVDESIINNLPNTYLVRARDSDKVYWLDQNIVRWISSPAVMEKLGFSFKDVVEVDSREIDYYFIGNPIFE